MIDFTNCEIDITSNYGGSDQKRGIIYNGKKYMLKLSDRINTDKRNDLNSSYSNSVYSEYICCHILNDMGIPAQETLLGVLNMVSKHSREEKMTPVVACKNFIPEGYSLIEFKNIENALLINKPGKIPKISEIYDILTNENIYFTKEFGAESLKRYWDTFIMDAFFGNFDRHANNWGYIINDKTHEITMAPVYDCGSCLYPQISDEAISKILDSEEERNMRIFKFPNAALELDNGDKANYHEYISSLCNEDCTAALLRIFPKINMKSIKNIINNTPDISDIRKTFYITMLQERYGKILEPTYEKALNLCKEDFVFDDTLDESVTIQHVKKDINHHERDDVRFEQR